MRVRRGETSPFFGGQVSLVSPWLHRPKVKREITIYIEKTTTSLLLSLFHPPALAHHLNACIRVLGGW